MVGTIPINKIVLFDGVCNLCSASVRFTIRRDKMNAFQFASLQSEFGRKTLRAKNIDDRLKTMLLLKNNNVYVRSDAALEICRDLSGLWPALYILKIIPRLIRDSIYDFISRNRYKWFGKTNECWLPSQELISRFVD